MLTGTRIGFEAMPQRCSIGLSVIADLMTWPIHRLGPCESCSHHVIVCHLIQATRVRHAVDDT
jgi:hypothetical protein